MAKDSIKKTILVFMLKAALTAVVPVLPFAVWYVAADPFKTLRCHSDYFPDPSETSLRVGMNKGMVTFANFEEKLREGRIYNGFIFGSSISCYYDAEEWSRLADTTGHVSAYHFDSASESVTRMAQKIEYLDRQGVPLRYALVVLDPLIMQGDYKKSPASINPPELHRSLSETIEYHYLFFRAATNADFFKSWIPSQLRDSAINAGRSPLFEPQPIVYDPVRNQETIPLWDNEIRTDPERFYSRHPLPPSPPEVTEGEPALNSDEKKEALRSIAAVFERNGTDYRIIIGPNRRKVCLNSRDMDVLCRIFNPRRVHDFSRSEARSLETDTLLYDKTHYRPPFASRLMRLVYSTE